MKVSFSTLGCPKLNMGEILAIAKDLGYDGVEMRGVGKVIDAPDIPDFAPERIEKTKAAFAAKGIVIPILTSAVYLHKKPDWPAARALALRYIDTAVALGVPYVRVLSDTGPAPEGPIDLPMIEDRLAELCAYAAPKGIRVLTETNGYFANSERLARLLEHAGESAGAIWDVHHPYRFFGESPKTTLENLEGRICHTHLKDSSKTPSGYKYELLGYGDVPVKEAAALLQEAGYQGFYSLEWVKRWDLTLEEPGIAFAQFIDEVRSYCV